MVLIKWESYWEKVKLIVIVGAYGQVSIVTHRVTGM